MFKRLDPTLVTFLKDRKLLLLFHWNMIVGSISIKDYFQTRKTLSITRYSAIRCAFAWRETNEGYNFWASIDTKWEIYLKFLGSTVNPVD